MRSIETPNTPYRSGQAGIRQDWYKAPWSTRQWTTKLDRNDKLYLLSINTNEELIIPMIPESLSESYSPKIVSVSPFGIIRPINFYIGGESKRVSFSFSLHEDYHVEDNLYIFLEKLKALSLPVDDSGVIRPPEVYIQLGSQFTGKGHIESSFELAKPFRNGRFIRADVSVSFTFHEEFETERPRLGDYTEDYPINELSYTGDLGILESIDDFARLTYDEDYFIEVVFGDKRVENFFNTIYSAPALLDIYSRERVLNFGEEVIDSGWYRSSFLDRVISQLYLLNSIINPVFSPDSIYKNLLKVDRNIDSIYSDYRNSYLSEDEKGSYPTYTDGQLDDFGWWYNPDNPNFKTLMSDTQKAYFESMLNYIQDIIKAFISIYAFSVGAGD